MNHIEVVDTLLQLSRPAPAPERVATFQQILARAGDIQAQFATARDEHYALAELVATLVMRALIPKVEPAAYPMVGKLYHAGVALRDHLDGDVRDLRVGVRAAREALVGPAYLFTSAMQVLERDLERYEGAIKRMAVLAKVAESALDTLAATAFVSTEFVVPPMNNQPAITAAS